MNELSNQLTVIELKDTELKAQLKQIIKSSKIDHNKEIYKEESLKYAHIYCKVNRLSGQITGSLIENYIKFKYNMDKNNSSECIGDLKYKNIDFEIKASNGGKDSNKFNYVQIRMNHVCEYILTAYYINESNLETLGELFIFRLNKDNIKKIILDYGSYAHGTITKLGEITADDLNDTSNDKEYTIRPKYGDECWKQLLSFRINDIDEIGV